LFLLQYKIMDIKLCNQRKYGFLINNKNEKIIEGIMKRKKYIAKVLNSLQRD